MSVETPTDALVSAVLSDSRADLEAAFLAHHPRVARALARIVRDHARAEELAVDVFLKWSRSGPRDPAGDSDSASVGTVGDDNLARAYGGVDALPATFPIDRQGRVAARRVALIPKAEYEQQIVRLLAER